MKTKIVICTLVLMFSAFAGSALGDSDSGPNTFYGLNAGQSTTTGIWDTFVGFSAGASNTRGSNNTYLGMLAGWGNTTGSNNVFLGHMAGQYETGSNLLYISNSDTSTPLIYGDFYNSTLTINGYLGIGTKAPVRALHLVGPNAVFRMDRSSDAAAFIMVRTDGSGNPLKTFIVGTTASGPNNGQFVIVDNGNSVSGGGNTRMTIANNGDVTFTGNVYATTFNPSSITLKDHVRTYENALDTVNRLRGVSFDWKDSGKPSVGLIAEEVAKVVPEVVAYNDGAATGVNYASLVGVLVEAAKEQQKEMDSMKEQQQRMNAKIAELEQLLMLK